VEVQDNCEMRNSNKYVVRGLQNEINVEVQDNCEMRNSNKYVLRGLQHEINVEVQDNVHVKHIYYYSSSHNYLVLPH
jgi:outer membrane receptor for ferrienterochelin and colicin